MKLLIIGDTHGNTGWVRTVVFPLAAAVQAEAIIQLGDFGAWEHTLAGIQFMDQVAKAAQTVEIPLYWLHGNHDKHSHTLANYEPDQRGFLPCREYLFYIPQGHTWSWAGVQMRAFGGAYSVDKQWRVNRDYQMARKQFLWFPEEEMTDNEMTELLAADSTKKDLIFSHDKPLSSKPTWNRKNIEGCIPNQVRLERALRVHQPAWWLHGHLHHFYKDTLHGAGFETTVVGLDPDGDAAEANWKRKQTWAIADLKDGTATVKLGPDVFVDRQVANQTRDLLIEH